MMSEKQDVNEKVLLEPYNYICQIPGKKVRTKLAAAFNCWLQIPEEKLKLIGEVTQMLHNASLFFTSLVFLSVDLKLFNGIKKKASSFYSQS